MIIFIIINQFRLLGNWLIIFFPITPSVPLQFVIIYIDIYHIYHNSSYPITTPFVIIYLIFPLISAYQCYDLLFQMPKTKGRRRRPPTRYTPSQALQVTPSTSSWEVTPMRPTTSRVTPVSHLGQDLQQDPPISYVRSLEERVKLLESASPVSIPVETLQSGEFQSSQPPAGSLIGTPSLPLYTALSKEIQDKVAKGEYVDLTSLTPTSHPPTDPRRPSPKFLNPVSWARAYMRLSSELIRQGKADPQSLLIHMDNVLGLAEGKHSWLDYDSSFRAQLVNAGYSFAHMRVELYAKAVSSPRPFRPQNNNQHKRQISSSQVPIGFCYKYHLPNQRCEATPCPYSHTCPTCGARHPMYICSKNKPQRPNSASHPKDSGETKPPKSS